MGRFDKEDYKEQVAIYGGLSKCSCHIWWAVQVQLPYMVGCPSAVAIYDTTLTVDPCEDPSQDVCKGKGTCVYQPKECVASPDCPHFKCLGVPCLDSLRLPPGLTETMSWTH